MTDRYQRGDLRSYHVLYSRWMQMLARCENPKHQSYPYYGGKGVTVCPRWRFFHNFVEDMGPCPEGMSIDRNDVAGNYSPDNCKWATTKEQGHNRALHVYVEVAGERMIYADALLLIGIRASSAYYRMRKLGETRQQAIDHFFRRNYESVRGSIEKDD